MGEVRVQGFSGSGVQRFGVRWGTDDRGQRSGDSRLSGQQPTSGAFIYVLKRQEKHKNVAEWMGGIPGDGRMYP